MELIESKDRGNLLNKVCNLFLKSLLGEMISKKNLIIQMLK